MLRKEFDVRGPIKRATVSVTGLGLYELRINGQRVGDQLLAPEYRATQNGFSIKPTTLPGCSAAGRNAVGAQLGGGWWTGPLAFDYHKPSFRFCLLMRLEIELADGSTQTVVTDPSWQSTTDGPIRCSGIYFGETYDARKEMPGWDRPGFAAAGWRPVQVLPHPDGGERAVLVAQCNEPIRVERELRPVKITEPKPGVYVFDMGQNMVGWCRLKANAPAGTKITLRHAEMLNDDGTIYTDNLRAAAQTERVHLARRRGHARTAFHLPRVPLCGSDGLAQPTGRRRPCRARISFGRSGSGRFCVLQRADQQDHALHPVGACGNMQSVPTDCPQRTERLGWVGDAQTFSQTAIFNRDMAAFYSKWVSDIRDSQADDGRFSDQAPCVVDPNQGLSGVPAWGDAGTVVPWHMYQNYADTRVLQQHFESARRWIEFIRSNNPNLLWQKNRGEAIVRIVIGSPEIRYRRSCLPRPSSPTPRRLWRKWQPPWAGRTTLPSMPACSRKSRPPLTRSMSPLMAASRATPRLATPWPCTSISWMNHYGPRPPTTFWKPSSEYKGHPSTGIQTTHRMMLELSRSGHHDEAWRLINLRTVPSWGYMVDMGATTIWEHWDSYVKGRGFQDPNMNSFNHPAFGAVGEWVWRELAGINPDEEQPGYKHFFIRPRPAETSPGSRPATIRYAAPSRASGRSWTAGSRYMSRFRPTRRPRSSCRHRNRRPCLKAAARPLDPPV